MLHHDEWFVIFYVNLATASAFSTHALVPLPNQNSGLVKKTNKHTVLLKGLSPPMAKKMFRRSCVFDDDFCILRKTLIVRNNKF